MPRLCKNYTFMVYTKLHSVNSCYLFPKQQNLIEHSRSDRKESAGFKSVVRSLSFHFTFHLTLNAGVSRGRFIFLI